MLGHSKRAPCLKEPRVSKDACLMKRRISARIDIMNATMRPLPDIAGALGATAPSIQIPAGAGLSGLVAVSLMGALRSR